MCIFGICVGECVSRNCLDEVVGELASETPVEPWFGVFQSAIRKQRFGAMFLCMAFSLMGDVSLCNLV